MIVGEPPVAVQLHEVGEQPLDVVERSRARRMAGHQHALPGGEVLVQLDAHGGDALFEACDLAIAVLGGRQHREGLDLLQQDADGFLELEQVSHRDLSK